MTITPLPPRPVTAGSPGPHGDRSGGPSRDPVADPAGFAALVSREADRLAGAIDGTATAPADEPPATADPAGVVTPHVPVVVVPGTGNGGGTGGDAGGGVDGVAGAEGAAAVEGTVEGAAPNGVGAGRTGSADVSAAPARTGLEPLGSPVLTPVSGGAGSAAATAGSDSAGGIGAAGVATPPASTTVQDLAAEPVPVVDGAGAAAGAPEAAATTPTPGPVQAPPVASEVVGASGIAGPGAGPGAEAAGTSTPTGEPARATTSALLGQVSPTLTRLVSRGDGEHRMTLRIHPADLGEVHLTVTVRGDRVDVDIAASPEARELLRDGLTSLRAMLDPTGRGGGQLVLRDLPTTPATGQSPAADPGPGGGPGGGADGRPASSGTGDTSRRGDAGGTRPGSRAARTPDGEAGAHPATARPLDGTRAVDLTL